MKAFQLGVVAIAALLATGIPMPAPAASSSTTIPVTATVAQSCTIASGVISFGLYDPVGANATTDLATTGAVTIACTKGAAGVTISLDLGTNAAAGQRNLKGTTNGGLLQYNLFQDAAHTTPWDNATHKYSVPTSVSKVAQVLNIYGVVPHNQDVQTDAYTDTVVATVNY